VSASLSRGMLSSFGLSGRCFVQLDVLSEAVGCRRLASKWIERGGAEQVAEVLAAPSEGIDALKDPGLRRVRRLAVVSVKSMMLSGCVVLLSTAFPGLRRRA